MEEEESEDGSIQGELEDDDEKHLK